MTVPDLVAAALERRPKAVLAQRCKASPMMIGRWLSGKATPEAEERAELERIVSEPLDMSAAPADGSAQPPADDKVAEAPQPAPGPGVMVPGVGLVLEPGQVGEALASVTPKAATHAISADRKRHEEDARDMAALCSSPGWTRIVLPAVLAKRETHRNALLDAKGRDVPLNQGAYGALAWLADFVRKPAEELAAARDAMPLFSDAGEPGPAKGDPS